MGFVSSAKLSEYTTKLMTKLRSIFATQAMIGAPKAAATVADMSDTDTIYVYTGSETGYVAGNWYYYEQGSWVSGGVYNAVAVVTDPTLSISGEAADAKSTGDRINITLGCLQGFGSGLIALLKAHMASDDPEIGDALDDLTDELFPDYTMESIEATYTQGSTVIYDTDTLADLLPDLVVVGNLVGGGTETITATAAMLSGTLTAGTSTITVTYRGLTDTFTVTVTHIASLDDIAYGTTTYREMFVTNNLAFLADLEMPLTLSSSNVTFDTGKTYKINAGTPTLVNDVSSSPSHSLKAFGSGSTQVKMDAPYVSLAAGKYLAACAVKCDRYSAGKVGFQLVPKNTSGETVNAVVQDTTDGFVAATAIATLAANRTGFEAYVGTMSSANADGYVDDIVYTPIPSDMTLEQATTLYETYLSIIRGAS